MADMEQLIYLWKLRRAFAININEKRPRWWFGGVASTIAWTITTPFDIVRSHMQTQHKKKNIWNTAHKIVQLRGFIGFYDGFSAVVVRQLTSSSGRFAIYEWGKYHDYAKSFYGKIELATVAGAVGGIIGVPTELICVRMQNDMKRPLKYRRNYNHVFDALVRIPREEGFLTLFNGTVMTTFQSILGTIGQIGMYDMVKTYLQYKYEMADTIKLHILSSSISSTTATVIIQPLDVQKTLLMNGRRGKFKNSFEVMLYMMRFGPTGIFRGLTPTLLRKGPGTVILFLLYEQLRVHFGIVDT